MTTTAPNPPVPVPDGASADPWDRGSRWAEDENRDCRLIHGRERRVDDSGVFVRAAQFSDGVGQQ